MALFEAIGLHKRFGDRVVLEAIDLAFEAGTLTGIMGPNGAGKTTCFNLISKFLTPTHGTIRFKGRDITQAKPHDVARMGMVRSFQISAVFPHLTVRDNVRIALQRGLGTSFHFWRAGSSLDVLNERAEALLADPCAARWPRRTKPASSTACRTSTPS